MKTSLSTRNCNICNIFVTKETFLLLKVKNSSISACSMPIMGSMVSRLSTVKMYSVGWGLVFLAGLGQEGTVVGCFLLRALFVLAYLTGQGLGLCGCFAFVVFSQAFLTVLLCHFSLETWDQIGFRTVPAFLTA